MKIMMIQPNYHSGGAEIAGNWPPSWVPYVGGALKKAGFENIRFVDAMTDYIGDDVLATIIAKNQPDVVLATAITPMIYQSQKTLQIVKEVCPNAKTIMGGVHPTFMYFDQSKILTHEQIAQAHKADVKFTGTLNDVPTAFSEGELTAISACGVPNNLLEDEEKGQKLSQPEHSGIQVFLIEDEEQTRVSMRKALRSQEGIDIYSEATNAETGLVLLQSVAGGDIALVDLSLPDKDGVELVQDFRAIQETSENPGLKLCILIAPEREEEMLVALAAGAESYCFKNAPVEQLAEAIKLTHAGWCYLDPQIAQRILVKVKDIPQETILTELELAILGLIAEGKSYEAIASSLGINVGMVKTQIGNILNRLYLSDLIQNSVKALHLV